MPNMADPIWTHATSAPERPALRSPSTTWNYTTLRDKVAAFAGHLRDRGISQGDRVLLIAPSVPEFAVAYYAAQAVGAIAVTLNTMSTPAEIEYVATDSGARHIVAWHASAAAGERVASKLTMDLVILDAGADDAFAWKPRWHLPRSCRKAVREAASQARAGSARGTSSSGVWAAWRSATARA